MVTYLIWCSQKQTKEGFTQFCEHPAVVQTPVGRKVETKKQRLFQSKMLKLVKILVREDHHSVHSRHIHRCSDLISISLFSVQ